MAKLTTKQRNNLPEVEFAGPNRSYPVNDKAHARNALARASQQQKAGNLSAAQAKVIEDKANAKLHPGGKTAHRSAADLALGKRIEKLHGA